MEELFSGGTSTLPETLSVFILKNAGIKRWQNLNKKGEGVNPLTLSILLTR